MINIEKRIEETKKRLEDARERQIDFDLDAEWNEDLDDLTATSVQLMEAHTDEVEALERQLEWLEYINRRTKLEEKISKRYFKPLDEVEERELVVKDLPSSFLTINYLFQDYLNHSFLKNLSKFKNFSFS